MHETGGAKFGLCAKGAVHRQTAPRAGDLAAAGAHLWARKCLADGEEWELEPMSEDYVYGMGMGATKDATRWAYKGFCLEVGQSIRKIAAKNNGRPRKEAYQSYDCLRALVIWEHVQKYIPQELRSGITNRALIEIMQDG